MALAAVGTQCDINTGATQHALDEGFFCGCRWRFSMDGFANGGYDRFPVDGGHPAKVADLMKTVRQDVGKETAGEEFDGYRIGLLDIVIGSVAPGIGDPAIPDVLDTAVADGNFVRIAGNIVQRQGRIVGCGFWIDDPGLVRKRCGRGVRPLIMNKFALRSLTTFLYSLLKA